MDYNIENIFNICYIFYLLNFHFSRLLDLFHGLQYLYSIHYYFKYILLLLRKNIMKNMLSMEY